MASSERHRYNETSGRVLEFHVETLSLYHVNELTEITASVADSSDGSTHSLYFRKTF